MFSCLKFCIFILLLFGEKGFSHGIPYSAEFPGNMHPFGVQEGKLNHLNSERDSIEVELDSGMDNVGKSDYISGSPFVPEKEGKEVEKLFPSEGTTEKWEPEEKNVVNDRQMHSSWDDILAWSVFMIRLAVFLLLGFLILSWIYLVTRHHFLGHRLVSRRPFSYV